MDGKIHPLLQTKFPTTTNSVGVGEAGTFLFICRECDSVTFQDYENEKIYNSPLANKVLAEIALKNYLQIIYKRTVENQIYRDRINALDTSINAQEKLRVGQIDLCDFRKQFFHAKKALTNQGGKKYYLGYYTVLDYVVPFAAQAAITLCSDFEDNIINNVYSTSTDYHVEQIHISVFPLKERSIIFAFTEDGSKRYRKFYKQLSKLQYLDQLSAINFIIFSYAENVFMSPLVAQQAAQSDNFLKVCRKTTDFISMIPIQKEDALPVLVKEYSLSQRNSIPNLLAPDYAI